MRKTQDLNDNWHLTWCSFQERKEDLLTGPIANWLPAKVPGDVHIDLMEAGEGPDPFFGLNADLWRWVEEKDWWYRLDFKMPKLSGGRAFLVFEGIDTFATIFLNGQKIAENFNMFTPIEIDVTDIGKQGEENKLAVRIASPIFSVDIRVDEKVGFDWNLPRLFARKAQFNYGWDIAPRLVSVGIWRPVRLEIYEKGRIKDIWIRTLSYDGRNAFLKAEVETEFFEKLTGEVWFVLELYEGEKKVVERKTTFSSSESRPHISLDLDVRNPRLWYPNDMGEPFLYSYKASLICNNKEIDSWQGNFSIRTVELVQEPQKEGGTSFYFKVNGEKIFVKGFNWTPADALPARITQERYEALLRLVYEAGANMLRVWGGGIYEPEIFYNLCDRLGIMIWQDFMFACGYYPQREEFLREVSREAEIVIKRLRHHPCLALWSGGNENDTFRFWREGKEYLKHRIRWVLNEICRTLDPQTPSPIVLSLPPGTILTIRLKAIPIAGHTELVIGMIFI